MTNVWRIRDRATFAALRSRGRRSRRGPLTVVWLEEAPGGTPARVAYAAGRALGSAVARNRMRRRLRAVVAELALPPGAWLVVAAPGAQHLSPAELRDRLQGAVEDLTAGALR